MLAFMAVFVFMMGAFVVGFHNLFSYFYMSQERIGLQEEDKVSSFSRLETQNTGPLKTNSNG